MKKFPPLFLVVAAAVFSGIIGCSKEGPSAPVLPADTTTTGRDTTGRDSLIVIYDTLFDYKASQVYIYESTPRDSNNQPVPSRMRLVTWTVLESGLTFQGRTNVSRILETGLAADGATVESRDTIHIATGNGEFHRYDLNGSMLRGIPLFAPFAGDLPRAWTKIGDTRNSNPLSYDAIVESSVTITDPALPVPIKVTYLIRGEHRGKGSVTVPLKTEPNAFATDLIPKIRVTDQSGLITMFNDSLATGYAMNRTDGILLQSVETRTVYMLNMSTLQAEPHMILGFDMKLRAKQ